jgi:ABC-type multidrug transport system ATPase subunit
MREASDTPEDELRCGGGPGGRGGLPEVPVLRFERVRKAYRRRRSTVEALAPLSLSVSYGQIAALVGRNGSGKTTALRIAATLVHPSSGTCRVLGQDVRGDCHDVRGLLGISLGSERAFYWRLTALQNLMFFAGVAGVRQRYAREAIVRTAAELDIERYLGRPVRQLSRGVMARLAVVRACLCEPSLLILDEPFASVDGRGRDLLWDALLRRVRNGRSVILATHDVSVAERCDTVARLSAGPA